MKNTVNPSNPDVHVRHGDASPLRAKMLTAAALVVPICMLVDLLRPILFERATIETINRARGIEERLFDTIDYVSFAALGVFILFVLLLAAAQHGRWRAKLTLAIWSVTLPWLVLELALRFLTPALLYRPNQTQYFEPTSEIMPGVSGRSRFSTNNLGLRGPNYSEDGYNVLCVGGSTTICTYLDDDEHWPSQLMKLLNTSPSDRRHTVFNAGKSGHDTIHHVTFLETFPKLDSIDLCLVLCGVNDLEHEIRIPYPIRRRLSPLHVFEIGGPFDPLRPILKQTFVYTALRRALYGTPAQQLMEHEDRSGRSYQLRREIRQAAIADFPLPDLEEALNRFRRHLRRIVALCEAKGVRCIFLTQPTIWHADMAPELERLIWSKPVGDTGRALSAAELARGMELFNLAMRDFCAVASVECIDLAAICPKDTSVFYDDEHFNENGSRLIAKTIAEYLLQHSDYESAP